MIKITGRLTAHDFLVTELLRNLGGASQLKLPLKLTADQRASLLNACLIPGMTFVVSGDILCLTRDEEPPNLAFLKKDTEASHG